MALIVFTGGARSGKSKAAEELALSRSLEGVPVTIAVFGRAGDDAEFAARIARHQSDRPAAFATLEADPEPGWVADVPDGTLLVLDCVGTMLGRVMESAWDESVAGGVQLAERDVLPDGYAQRCETVFSAAVDELMGRAGDTVIVTNEVGDGLVPEYATGRLFRDLMGRANRRLIDAADGSYLVIAGRLLELSRLPRAAYWPHD